ncbi:hypothetical protein BpHYR1_032918 [Brachionus plicatilis]|uniref:Uncharacterized protein n=1 Tax=Brachionus plicatilis TaxID=10195 RepID=A0A3M7T587_BRAPC|nr:hypothetical protein BpHYR1_032918 [Brachionus plicatilis]
MYFSIIIKYYYAIISNSFVAFERYQKSTTTLFRQILSTKNNSLSKRSIFELIFLRELKLLLLDSLEIWRFLYEEHNSYCFEI